VKVAKLATETNFWPLYEIENGKYKINWATEKPKPVSEFLKIQGRFKHLLKPENKKILEHIQKKIDEEWMKLVKLSE
jgi:pyruvate ferredoxin oxidoreductase beta subunit